MRKLHVNTWRSSVAAILLVAAHGAWADEPPSTTPTDQAVPAAAPAAAPAAVAAPAPAEATSAPTGRKKILLLPIEYMAFQRSAGGVTEAVPEWTESCKSNTAVVLQKLLGEDSRFELVTIPDLSDEEKATLREHVELFKVVSNDAVLAISFGGKAWQDKRAHFDYTLGPGLKFLKERSGADAAFIFGGVQTTQSGGSVFLQLLMAGLTGAYIPGGGSFITFGSVNLDDGRIDWFNSLLGQDVFGAGGVDLRKADSAEKTVTKLLSPYPTSPLVGMKIL